MWISMGKSENTTLSAPKAIIDACCHLPFIENFCSIEVINEM